MLRSTSSQLALWLPIIGVVLVVGALLSYSLFVSNIEVSSSSLSSLSYAAYVTVLSVLLGLVMVVAGITVYVRGFEGAEAGRLLSTLAAVLGNKFSIRTLVASAVLYGVLFALFSGTLVVRPGADFSQMYGASIPSIVPAVCCGPFGQIPQIVIYVTQQVALLIIPLNLVLLIAISWLVGVNSALAVFAFKNRPRSNAKWITGIGATVGLFSACPTCAGLFFWTSINLSGALTATIAFGSFQGIFVLFSLPLLVSTIVMMSRQIDLKACAVPGRGS